MYSSWKIILYCVRMGTKKTCYLHWYKTLINRFIKRLLPAIPSLGRKKFETQQGEYVKSTRLHTFYLAKTFVLNTSTKPGELENHEWT